MNDLKPKTAAAVVLLFILAIIASALYDLQPPNPLPVNAPDSLFSADRAAGYIKEISRVPHPLGSHANSRVRQFICSQLVAMGFQPQLDTAVVTGSYIGIHYTTSVINIIARLAGTANTRAVVLMAHYDSVPTGPGASDDGSGVATILETLRALKASHPLKNDVVGILTDGEEVGMMGAQAISEDNSLMRQVGVVMNFESRGTSGPTLMFETSEGNGWLIKQMAEAAPDPIAASLFYDAYKHLPNNTDFTWLKTRDAEGLNFAFIGDPKRYHTELDDYANVDESTLQHEGSYALSLIKHFGNLTLPGPKSQNYNYFNFFWPNFVYYGSNLVPILSVIAALFYFLAVYLGIRKKVVKTTKAIVGIFALLIPMGLLGAGTYFLWKALQNSYPESRVFLFGVFYGDGVLICAAILLSVALTSAYYIFLRKFFRSSEMAVGALFWWLALTVVSNIYLPHSAYLFQWPLIFSSLALAIFFLGSRSDFRSPTVMLTLLVCAVPGIYLVTQIEYLFHLVGLLPVVAALLVVLTILATGTLLPHIAIISAPNRWLLPLVVLVLSIIVGSVALLGRHIDPRHPKADSIDYAVNMNDSTAFWVSFDDSTDEWTSQFIRHPMAADSIPEFFPKWWTSPPIAEAAPPVSIPPVSVKMLSDTISRGAQFMQLLVRSPFSGSPMVLTADAGTQILSSSVDGYTVPDSVAIFPVGKQRRWILHCYGFSDSGAIVSLVIPVGETLKLTTVEIVNGLPAAAGFHYFPRPGSMIRRPFVTTDASVVMKSYTF